MGACLTKDTLPVDASDEKQRVLLDAAASGDLLKVRNLIVAMVDVNCSDQTDTPLTAACRAGHYDICHHLLVAGAKPDQFAPLCEWNPLLIAAETDQEEIASLLLENSADCRSTNVSGHNALYQAASKGHDSIVTMLLEFNADPNIGGITKNMENHPLRISAKNGHYQTAELLIANRADVSFIDDWMEFVPYGQGTLIRQCIDRGKKLRNTSSSSSSSSSLLLLSSSKGNGHEGNITINMIDVHGGSTNHNMNEGEDHSHHNLRAEYASIFGDRFEDNDHNYTSNSVEKIQRRRRSLPAHALTSLSYSSELSSSSSSSSSSAAAAAATTTTTTTTTTGNQVPLRRRTNTEPSSLI